MTITTETGTLNPVQFWAPPVNPSPTGLYAATAWQPENTAPARFLAGVHILPENFDGASSSGVWGADWCAQPDDLTPDDVKKGERWAGLDPFDPVTMWGYDECALTAESRAEVKSRAAQTLRVMEQPLFEREFGGRLQADLTAEGGPIDAAAPFLAALGMVEAYIAMGGQQGVIHAAVNVAPMAAFYQCLVKTGSGYLTPMGNRWVFGGGYLASIGSNTLMGTSPLYGWRDEIAVRETIKSEQNKYAVVAERSVLVGYEHFYGAMQITG